jgi:hypothetical protein
MATRKKAAPVKEESFNVKGEDLLKKVKEIIHEGNVRKITIKDKTGKELIVLPLSLGVVGAVFAPALAAVGAIAALIAECTITVEKDS